MTDEPIGTPRPLMDRKELYALAQIIFGAAMRDAAEEGETVMEDGRDEHFWASASGYDMLRAAASYFESIA